MQGKGEPLVLFLDGVDVRERLDLEDLVPVQCCACGGGDAEDFEGGEGFGEAIEFGEETVSSLGVF